MHLEELKALAVKKYPHLTDDALDVTIVKAKREAYIEGLQRGRDEIAELNARLDVITAAAAKLLERIDKNGGIGEYNGGPAFVVEPLRAAVLRN